MANGFENGGNTSKGADNVGDSIGKHGAGESGLNSVDILKHDQKSDIPANKIAEGSEAGKEADKVKITDKADEQVDSFDKADHAAGVSDHLDNASQHLDKLKGTDQEDNAKNVLKEMGELMGKSAAEITGDKGLGQSLGESVGKGNFDAIKQAVGAAKKQ